jgi:peptidoglycan/LPS O-acetylase OafA/YrhL
MSPMVSPSPPATASTAQGTHPHPSPPPPAPPDPDALREEPNLSYIPALDGIRAFAVLGVMAYHGGIPWLPAGFLGVDAFFVLSGFLITSLLISEWQRRRTIGLGRFWARRARRLLPALLLLLVFVVLYANLVAPAGTYPGLRLDSLSTLFYVANWHFILIGSNYFNQTSLPSLLTHTWSLAVEEQFYLLWPLVVLAILKFTGRLWALLAVSVVGALASAAEMALLFRHGASTTRLYYGTDTHGQCLLVGAALASGLALFARRRHAAAAGAGPTPGGNPGWAASSSWARTVLSVLGGVGGAGVGLLWWRVSFNGAFLWEGGFLVAALATAAVLVCVVCAQRSWLATALSVSPLRYLGRISYGLYLWHFPLFQWIDGQRTGLGGYALFGVRCGATLAVATASFYLVERPIRHGALFRRWRAWVGAPAAVAAVTLTVVLATGAGTVAAVGPPTRVHPGASGSPGASGAHTTVLVLGDSTALTLSIGLSYDAKRYGATVVDKGILGCGVAVMPEVRRTGVDATVAPACNPSTPSAQQWPALWTGWIHQYHPAIVTVLAGRWEVSTVEWRGQWTDILEPAFAAYVKQQLVRAVDVGSSGGAPVVLFTAPCFDSGEQSDGAPWPEDQPDRVNAYNALVRQVVAANRQKATLVDLYGVVCPGGTYETQIGGVTVRAPDGVHFPFYSPSSPQTADPDTEAQVRRFGTWLAPRLWPSILAAAGDEPPGHPASG